MDTKLRSLLESCLSVEPSKRLTPLQLLEHEAFKNAEEFNTGIKTCIKTVIKVNLVFTIFYIYMCSSL